MLLCLIHEMVWPYLTEFQGCCLHHGSKCSLLDIFITVSFLQNPWKKSVANNFPSASLSTHGTDLGECSVFSALDTPHCLMFLKRGLASLCMTAFDLGWAHWCS